MGVLFAAQLRQQQAHELPRIAVRLKEKGDVGRRAKGLG